ncbi:GIY-YIG nuclease family protein [Candidatus Symbiopectobacterium sp. NZEC127]|uniref:GIY-YIG nuclease family protein n=1 Tax=Candidatus Symbiopectobacterium sp. NZEC127 TaxID=2820472 RepID=UPI002225E021|nr:GIY-YIG nuclease family protein [Candidatus Symbiopectobacterium sp. NZEC127]MCW2488624.1 GIY-YIG nuclease family protein [Candidatus Symbiopectobacterium sp. NZEC127]
MSPSVYILTNKPNGTLYVGVTSNLIQRIWQHKNLKAKGFTQRYNLNQLVYYEYTENMLVAIQREKQLKKWRRAWKTHLIEAANPLWNDLFFTLF